MVSKIIIIIIIIIIIVISVVVYLLLKKPQISKTIQSSRSPMIIPNAIIPNAVIPNAVIPTNIPIWYSNKSPGDLYHYPEEYYSNKPLMTDPTNTSNPTIGIAFSGGGIRAACSTYGFLQALNSFKYNGKSLLHRDYISYISCNSGSTWAVLPIFYQPIGGSAVTVDQILGSYSGVSVDFTQQPAFPNYINVAVNNFVDVELEGNWWINSIANSYFKPYGLFDPTTKGIVGIDSNSISGYLSTLGSSYRGITLRDNMPIPIAISSVVNKSSNGYSYLPIDSSPISSGFVVSTKVNTVDPSLTISSYGGRVSTFAFNTKQNTVIGDSPLPKDLGNGHTQINIAYGDTAWEPAVMSGTSSLAAGPELLPIPSDIPIAFINTEISIPFLEDFIIQTEYTSPANAIDKIIDGYLVDDTSIISLLARKTQRIVVTLNVLYSDVLNPSDGQVGSVVMFISGPNENKFGTIISSTGTQFNISLLGKNAGTVVSAPHENITSFFIGHIDNVFNGPLPMLDNNVIGYNKTRDGMMLNYANTGIFYYQGIYKTVANPDTDIIEYNPEILWYCLSPCPNFKSQLSVPNQNILNNMFLFPNFCTQGPVYNDCNTTNTGTYADGTHTDFYRYCTSACVLKPVDVILNSGNIQTVSNSQALSVSSLTAWICNQIVIPFITGTYGVAIPAPQPIPSFVPTITPPPGLPPPIPEDKISILLKIIFKPLNNKLAEITPINMPLSQFQHYVEDPFGVDDKGACPTFSKLYAGARVGLDISNTVFSLETLSVDKDTMQIDYATKNVITLNLSYKARLQISGLKCKIWLGIGFDCNKQVKDHPPTTSVNFDTTSADLNGTISISAPVSYLNGVTTIDFLNSTSKFLGNATLSNYVPPLSTTVSNVIYSYFTSNWALVLILGALSTVFPLEVAIRVFEKQYEDLIDNIIPSIQIPDSIFSFLGQVALPIPCDLCNFACPKNGNLDLFTCSNHGTCITNTGICRCAPNTGWSGNTCNVCDTAHWDNKDGLCNKCLNGWTSIQTGCKVCPPAFDNTDGTCKCDGNFVGPQCQWSSATTCSSAGYPDPVTGKCTCNNLEVFQPVNKSSTGNTYTISQDQAASTCAQYNSSVLATTVQLQDTQKQGADWCSTGWVADSNTPMYPINTSTLAGCGGGGTGIMQFLPLSNQAAVNCYGLKPITTSTTPILPFNQTNYSYYDTHPKQITGLSCQYSRDKQCSSHGNPDDNGNCTCDVGWALPNCASCATNYSGPDCSICTPTCTKSCGGSNGCSGICSLTLPPMTSNWHAYTPGAPGSPDKDISCSVNGSTVTFVYGGTKTDMISNDATFSQLTVTNTNNFDFHKGDIFKLNTSNNMYYNQDPRTGTIIAPKICYIQQ